MMSGGLKYDDGKARWDLLPMGALHEVTKVYTFGVGKYEAWNWRKGIVYSKCFAAIMRHLFAWWWDREERDAESGCHPLSAVVFYCLNIMQYEQDQAHGLDDRPSLPTDTPGRCDSTRPQCPEGSMPSGETAGTTAA
jgi:hypothetical protein